MKKMTNGKNVYAVFVDGNMFNRKGDYKSINKIYDDVLKTAPVGSLVKLIKIYDNLGNEINYVKKSEKIKKNSNKDVLNKTKHIQETIKVHLLELYHKTSLADVRLCKSHKKLSGLTHRDVKIDETFEIEFNLTPRDYYSIIFSEKELNSIDFNKEYDVGTIIKKPYNLLVLGVFSEKGVSLTIENISKLKKKYKRKEKLSHGEERVIYLIDKANNMIFNKDSDVDNPSEEFNIVMSIKIVKNVCYGMQKKFISDDYDNDEINHIKDNWNEYLTDNYVY